MGFITAGRLILLSVLCFATFGFTSLAYADATEMANLYLWETTDIYDCNGTPDGTATLDQCGVCGGDGMSCVDACGILWGDGSSCLDCSGAQNGTASYDQCGVCGGDGLSCLDACGVLWGDGTSCLDCAGMPNGTTTYDQCGVCGGDGMSCLDSCGVIGGDGTSCTDCSGTPNGTATHDQCGVCGGDGMSCVDACGILWGDGSSCLDCNGTQNGTATHDQCGVCGGDGMSCLDACGVLWGDGTSCLDCADMPNGTTTYDQCGICGGDSTSCMDACGILEGDGTTCVNLPEPCQDEPSSAFQVSDAELNCDVAWEPSSSTWNASGSFGTLTTYRHPVLSGAGNGTATSVEWFQCVDNEWKYYQSTHQFNLEQTVITSTPEAPDEVTGAIVWIEDRDQLQCSANWDHSLTGDLSSFSGQRTMNKEHYVGPAFWLQAVENNSLRYSETSNSVAGDTHILTEVDVRTSEFNETGILKKRQWNYDYSEFREIANVTVKDDSASANETAEEPDEFGEVHSGSYVKQVAGQPLLTGNWSAHYRPTGALAEFTANYSGQEFLLHYNDTGELEIVILGAFQLAIPVVPEAEQIISTIIQNVKLLQMQLGVGVVQMPG